MRGLTPIPAKSLNDPNLDWGNLGVPYAHTENIAALSNFSRDSWLLKLLIISINELLGEQERLAVLTLYIMAGFKISKPISMIKSTIVW